MVWTTTYAKPPRRLKRTHKRNTTPTGWLRPEHSAGVAVAITIIASIWMSGWPHIRWNGYYHSAYNGGVHFTRCSYTGPLKTFDWRPADGTCPLIKWVRSNQ